MVGAAYRKSGPAKPTKLFRVGRVRYRGRAKKLRRRGNERSSTGSPYSCTVLGEDGRKNLTRKLVDRTFDGAVGSAGLHLQGRFGLLDRPFSTLPPLAQHPGQRAVNQ